MPAEAMNCAGMASKLYAVAKGNGNHKTVNTMAYLRDTRKELGEIKLGTKQRARCGGGRETMAGNQLRIARIQRTRVEKRR